MACSSCKKKNRFKEKYEETTAFVGNATVIFILIWSAFAIYGIYSLVTKFL